jgi:hypothetical protein
MPDRKHEVHVKAKAFVDTLSKLKGKEREQTPTGHYGEDYNNLRALAMDVEKELDARSWPPAVQIRKTAQGQSLCEGTYAEIETYARQILYHFPLELATGFVG